MRTTDRSVHVKGFRIDSHVASAGWSAKIELVKADVLEMRGRGVVCRGEVFDKRNLCG